MPICVLQAAPKQLSKKQARRQQAEAEAEGAAGAASSSAAAAAPEGGAAAGEHPGVVRVLTFSPLDGAWLMTASDDKLVRLWDTYTWRCAAAW